MNKIEKIIITILSFIVLSMFAYGIGGTLSSNGVDTVNGNFTGNINTETFSVETAPVSCTGNNRMTFWNGSHSICSDSMGVTGDTVTGNYTFDSTTFHIDSTNNRVGIGTTSPSAKLNVIGDMNITQSADTQAGGFKMTSSTGQSGGMYHNGTHMVMWEGVI